MKTIYLLEPFLTGSHQRWAGGLVRQSRHDVKIIGRPGRHWKWRMHGAAVTMAREVRSLPKPDLLLATDMLDLAVFRSLYGTGVPAALYFHENQITYPWSPTDEDVSRQRDRHYGWINYTSALAAEAVAFNSHHHRVAFLEGLGDFLRRFPDDVDEGSILRIKKKSTVLPLGVELPEVPKGRKDAGPPILLWNHRWEYDKAPEVFFNLCRRLKSENLPFRLLVLGERTERCPRIFPSARKEFSEEILHWGYVKDRRTYWQQLSRADILPVTSRQDFFGISTVEAIHAGAWPLLPDRLAFPEHLPPGQTGVLYRSEAELFDRCAALIRRGETPDGEELRKRVGSYRWENLIHTYDDWLAKHSG